MLIPGASPESSPYGFAECRLRRVGVDYHVELEGHFYSVPYRFARSEVEVRPAADWGGRSAFS